MIQEIRIVKFNDKWLVVRIVEKQGIRVDVAGVYKDIAKAREYKRLLMYIMLKGKTELMKLLREVQDER